MSIKTHVIGYLRNGQPVWSIAGGADDDLPPDPPDNDEPSDTDGETDWQAEADKWKSLSRKWEDRAKSNADAAEKLAEIEDSKKSEIEKATEKAAEAQKIADKASREAARLRIALDRGLTGDRAKTFAKRLTGETEEELEADADDLLQFIPAEEAAGDTSSRLPREKLKPGASTDSDPDETDMNALLRAAVKGE